MALYRVGGSARAEAVAAELRRLGFVATVTIRYSGPHVSIDDTADAEEALLHLEPTATPAAAPPR